MFNIDQTFQTGRTSINRALPLPRGLAMFVEDNPWFQAYQAAMLELDPQKLPDRIVAAKEAVQLRLEEIQGDTDHHAERQQMEEALSSLRTLEREK
jgi:hypothetical protein